MTCVMFKTTNPSTNGSSNGRVLFRWCETGGRMCIPARETPVTVKRRGKQGEERSGVDERRTDR